MVMRYPTIKYAEWKFKKKKLTKVWCVFWYQFWNWRGHRCLVMNKYRCTLNIHTYIVKKAITLVTLVLQWQTDYSSKQLQAWHTINNPDTFLFLFNICSLIFHYRRVGNEKVKNFRSTNFDQNPGTKRPWLVTTHPQRAMMTCAWTPSAQSQHHRIKQEMACKDKSWGSGKHPMKLNVATML